MICVGAHAADAPYEFTGVLTADGKTRIALTNKTTKTTEWVEAGGQLGGYSVARYESKDDIVVLKKGMEEIRLPLVAAKTVEAPTAPVGLRGAVSTTLPSTTAAPPAMPTPAPTPPPLPTTPAMTPQPPASAQPSGANPTPPAQNVIINVPTAPPPGAATGETTEAAPSALTPTGREPPSPSYTIQGGDTWEKVSAATGVSIDELKRLNPVVNGSSLPSGQTIRIR